MRIRVEAERIFGALAKRNELCGLERNDFVDAAGDLFIEINNLHAFREGNGRAQRIFLRALAANAGYDLAFDVVTRERMIAVSVAGINGDSGAIKRLFMEISDAGRVAALRKALRFLKSTNDVPWNDLYIATTVAGQAYAGVLVGKADGDFMMRVSSNPQDWIAIGSTVDLPEVASPGDNITISTKRF